MDSVVDNYSETEKKILESARKVFVEKGLYGARMQEIADEAGINKAMLHYYFRSKDKLFYRIFSETLTNFFPKIQEIISSEKPLFEKLEGFIITYQGLLRENPMLPAFVINEINREPDMVLKIFGEIPLKIQSGPLQDLQNQLELEAQKGTIKPVDAKALIVNILAMCIFPIVAKPVMKYILFKNDEVQYDAFLNDRVKEVFNFIKNSISVK